MYELEVGVSDIPACNPLLIVTVDFSCALIYFPIAMNKYLTRNNLERKDLFWIMV